MKTSTIALLVVVAVLYMQMQGGGTPTRAPVVTPPPEPRTAYNPGGDTFSEIMRAITAVAGSVKAGIEASTDRNATS